MPRSANIGLILSMTSMKKIIFLLFAMLLIPHVAHAYVEHYWSKILFVSSQTPLQVTTKPSMERIVETIEISGDPTPVISQLKGVREFTDENQSIIPLYDSPIGRNDYKFWKIEGDNAGSKFSIIGMTFEGHLLENKIFPQSLLILIFMILCLFLFLKKKSSNASHS